MIIVTFACVFLHVTISVKKKKTTQKYNKLQISLKMKTALSAFLCAFSSAGAHYLYNSACIFHFR